MSINGAPFRNSQLYGIILEYCSTTLYFGNAIWFLERPGFICKLFSHEHSDQLTYLLIKRCQLLYVILFNFPFTIIWHVKNIPTMQYFTDSSRNAQSKSYMLSLPECVWEFLNKHYVILIIMPYYECFFFLYMSHILLFASVCSGTHCTQDVDECQTNPCRNGATCHNESPGYQCICVNGWEGVHCETNHDDCTPNRCR